MPITEELQFSVLSAPLAAADRRVFSQAWYSALYRTDARAAARNHVQLTQAAEGRPLSGTAANEPPARENIRSLAPRRAAQAQQTARLAIGERRGPRLQLARKIARFVLQPQRKNSGATFTIDGARGRVRILVRTDGSRLRLIALCAVAMKATVAAALAQARYALATRGANVTARVCESDVC